MLEDVRLGRDVERATNGGEVVARHGERAVQVENPVPRLGDAIHGGDDERIGIGLHHDHGTDTTRATYGGS